MVCKGDNSLQKPRVLALISIPSLKLTAFAPENGWLEYEAVSFWGPGLFSGATLVSGSVGLDVWMCGDVSKNFPTYPERNIPKTTPNQQFIQWLFLVPLKGGR